MIKTLNIFIVLLLIAKLSTVYGHGGVRFIANQGQWMDSAIAKADITNGKLFITQNGLKYLFYDGDDLGKAHHQGYGKVKTHSVFYEFLGGDYKGEVAYSSPSSEKYNFYKGSNPDRWKAGLSAYHNIVLKDVYPGIDVLTEGGDGTVKNTYIVHPNKDYQKIKIKIKGADKIFISRDKNLHIKTSVNEVIEDAPIVYQIINNEKVYISAKYYLEGDVVSFKLNGNYNADVDLFIDPKVVFATFSGSVADNFGFTATYDSFSRGYSGGTVYDFGFPVTSGALIKTFQGGTMDNGAIGDLERDGGILLYSADGTKLLYCTYLGGAGNEQPHSMVVDGKNNLLVMGATRSTDFPTTNGAYDRSYNDSSDIYITKLSGSNNTLLASTYIGGKGFDGLNGKYRPNSVNNFSPLCKNYGDLYRGEIISDVNNNIYVASMTSSINFPTTSYSFQPTQGGGRGDGLVFSMDDKLSKIRFSSYIGGTKYDAAFGLQLNSKGELFINGGTQSAYFFNDTIAYQNRNNGDVDAFVCCITSDSGKLVDATFIGTTKFDQSYFVQIDLDDKIYLYGQTQGPSNFPIKNVKYVNANSGQFISKFNSKLDTLIYSGQFGSRKGVIDISPSAFLVDDCGKIYVSGWGGNTNDQGQGGPGGSTDDLPITSDGFQKNTDGSDFYLAVFARDMDTLLFGSYFGGTVASEEHVDGGTSRFDKRGVVYQSVCGGCGGYSDFPTTSNSWSPTNKGKRPGSNAGGCNNLLFKLDLDIPDMQANFDAPLAGCYPYKVKMINKSLRAKSYLWIFDDGTTSTSYEPTHTFKNAGTYKVKLVTRNLLTCTTTDTAEKTIEAYYVAIPDFSLIVDSCNGLVKLDATKSKAEKFLWDFGNGKTDTIQNPITQYDKLGKYNIRLIVDNKTNCADTLIKPININRSDFDFVIDTCDFSIKITKLDTLDGRIIWIVDNIIYTDTLPKFNFTTPGIHRIGLIVRSNNPCDTVWKDINIPIRAKSKINYVIDSCNLTARVLSYSPSGGNQVWVVEGRTYTGKNLTFTFPKPGIYVIKLINYAGTLCADTTYDTLAFNPKKQADFTYEIEKCGNTIKFTAQTFGKYSFRWDFGDGEFDTSANPVIHKYAKKGAYQVSFYINASQICADTIVKEVIIPELPVAKFSAITEECSGKVIFKNESDPKRQLNYWYFGDGGTSREENPVYTYKKRGNYTPYLVINKGTACEDSFQVNISAGGFNADSLQLYNVITPNKDGLNDAWELDGILQECLEYELWIFNRWGQEMYYRKGTKHSWEGKSKKDEDLPAGTYFFLLISDAYDVYKKGTITIVR
jgi:gliding motility-associated-like protein